MLLTHLWVSTSSFPGNGLGIRVVGGKEVPGTNGDIGAYVAKVLPGGVAQQTGKILEGKLSSQILGYILYFSVVFIRHQTD